MADRTQEDDVDWAPVNDEECEELFAESDDEKEDAAMVSEDEADEATSPSTQMTTGQSSDDENSSVEEVKDNGKDDGFLDDNWEDQSARPSWVANDSTVDDGPVPKDSMSARKPPPYSPSPAKIANSEVERLEPGKSRLASFSSGLQHRFSDSGSTSQKSDTSGTQQGNNGDIKPILFPANTQVSSTPDDDEDDFPQAEPWPGDDAEELQDGGSSEAAPDEEGADEDEEEEDREASGGDAFASEPNPSVKSTRKPSASFSRELSTNWMKFDDDKWSEASKHEEGDGTPPQKHKAKSASFSSDTATPAASKNKEEEKWKGFFPRRWIGKSIGKAFRS